MELASEIYFNLHSKQKIISLLKDGERLNGKSIKDDIECIITTDILNGTMASSLVKIGNTRVMCGIKACIGQPDVSSPHKGYIIPNFIYTAGCSMSAPASGVPTSLGMKITAVLDELIKAELFVNLEDLIIDSGKSCWVLNCNIVCLEDDGSLESASLSSLIAALSDVFLPNTLISDSGFITIEAGINHADKNIWSNDLYKKLNVLEGIKAINYASISNTNLIYPTKEEEKVADGKCFLIICKDSKTSSSKILKIDSVGIDYTSILLNMGF